MYVVPYMIYLKKVFEVGHDHLSRLITKPALLQYQGRKVLHRNYFFHKENNLVHVDQGTPWDE